MRCKPRSPAASSEQALLPEAELEVLACLRRLAEATAADVREGIESFRPMAHASVATLLHRLEEKGMVTRRKGEVGKAFLYRPTARAEATFGSAANRLLRRVFADDSARLVASLFGSHDPSRDELERLKAIVDELYANAEEDAS